MWTVFPTGPLVVVTISLPVEMLETMPYSAKSLPLGPPSRILISIRFGGFLRTGDQSSLSSPG